MGREIKFRAWIDGKMNHDPILWGSHELGECWPNWAFQHQTSEGEIWMQFTGLRDKNGKEIYEGDVLRCTEAVHDEGCSCEHCFPLRVGDVGAIKWCNDRFLLIRPEAYMNGEPGEREDYCDSCAAICGLYSENHEIPLGSEVEVIGNIYENQDLIKK